MNAMRFAFAALLLCCPAALTAQAFSSSVDADSSSAETSLPATPAPTAGASAGFSAMDRIPGAGGYHPRAFHALAIGLRVGTGGIGVEVGTPLSTHFTLRGGAQFFDHTAPITQDGFTTQADITLQNVYASVDYLPFRRSGFRISPGVTIHNDNHVAGPISIAGGQTFSLGDQDYTSDPTNPIMGFTRIRFGNTVAPRLTVGYGNLFPASGRHLSFPVEIGFQYTSDPTFDLVLGGSACTSEGCGDINQEDGPQNIRDEIKQLNDDIKPLRFFPIASFGIMYRFGGNGTR